MQFNIPQTLPPKAEMLNKLLEAIFPDLETLKPSGMPYKKNAGGYTNACKDAVYALGLVDRFENGLAVKEGSSLYACIGMLAEQSQGMFGDAAPAATYTKAGGGDPTLFTEEKIPTTFCAAGKNSLSNWLKKEGNFANPFEVALFYGYLLLARDACATTRVPFLHWCLQTLGLAALEVSADDFAWGQGGAAPARGTQLLGAAVLTLCMLYDGRKSDQTNQQKIEAFHAKAQALFAAEFALETVLAAAPRVLCDCNTVFTPRSITTSTSLAPQNVFVMPSFSCDGQPMAATPFASLQGATTSQRKLLVAKTGLGKSLLLQMATVCMLGDQAEFEQPEEAQLVDVLTAQLQVPSDVFLISVPARMFTYCYTKAEYQGWTGDFISLFFNSLLTLKPNFFSSSLGAETNRALQPEYTPTEAQTQALRNRSKALARSGKLVLLIDSFDEVPAGNMRAQYLAAVHSFTQEYCNFDKKGEVGAHILVTSRQMSPDTMKALKDAMLLPPEEQPTGICSLGDAQMTQLVERWRTVLNRTPAEVKPLLAELKQNPYYKEYAENPYMLSVICWSYGKGLVAISQKLIETLTDKMRRNRGNQLPAVQDVLNRIESVLQQKAWETVQGENPRFSRREINEYFKTLLAAYGLDAAEEAAVVESLHEILVIDAGLIVPADGFDDHYQFINNQIRLALAAAFLDEQDGDVPKLLCAKIKSFPEYLGVLVPLLCKSGTAMVERAEQLVYELMMRACETPQAQQQLAAAILDLFFSRYDENILSMEDPGRRDALFVAKAQRLALMRLFTLPNLQTTAAEKALLKLLPVYQKHQGWISAEAKDAFFKKENP